MSTVPRTEPRIETATLADLAGLVALRRSQEWTPHMALLTAMLGTDAVRINLIRAGAVDASAVDPDEPIATTSALAAGPVGVIGNVIVSDAYQRRGLGRALMADALAWQRERGAGISLLDATAAGRPLYRSLGYVSTQAYSWFARAKVGEIDRDLLRERSEGGMARLSLAAALDRVVALDLAAFGGDRMALLTAVAAQPNRWLYLAEDVSGAVRGYAFVRLMQRPRLGIQVGPLIAMQPTDVAALFAAIMADDAPWRGALPETDASALDLRLSLPPLTDAGFALFAQCGLRLERDDLLMRLDLRQGVPSGSVAWSIAPHPEWVWGWLAPMVF